MMAGEDESVATPTLRFPEFRRLREWKKVKLNSVMSERGLKSDGRSEVHSVSLKRGIVPQIEHLGRSYASSDTSHYTLVNPFDVVYTKSPLALFPLGIVKQHRQNRNAIVSPLYGVFTPVNRFVGYLIEAYLSSPARNIKYLDPLAQKGAKNTIQISNDRFLSGEIYLPSSELEQQKIADCLTSLDEVIAAQRRKVEALKDHKRGLMQQLFPREGETIPRLRFPDFSDDPHWNSRTLGDIAAISSGTTPLRANHRFYDGGTIPWVKTTDLNNSFIDCTEESVTSEARITINPADSVLVAMYGGFNQIGRTGYLRVAAATNQALSVLRVKREQVLPLYVLTWLNAKVGEWKRIASSSRKDPNITGSDVARFPIQLPSIAEQHRIAECVRSIEEEISNASKIVKLMHAHKTGLMQQLFPTSGED